MTYRMRELLTVKDILINKGRKKELVLLIVVSTVMVEQRGFMEEVDCYIN